MQLFERLLILERWFKRFFDLCALVLTFFNMGTLVLTFVDMETLVRTYIDKIMGALFSTSVDLIALA